VGGSVSLSRHYGDVSYVPQIGRPISRQFLGGWSVAIGVGRYAKELEYLTLERG